MASGLQGSTRHFTAGRLQRGVLCGGAGVRTLRERLVALLPRATTVSPCTMTHLAATKVSCNNNKDSQKRNTQYQERHQQERAPNWHLPERQRYLSLQCNYNDKSSAHLHHVLSTCVLYSGRPPAQRPMP